MKVFLNEYIHPDAVARLQKYVTVTDKEEELPEVDAIILRTYKVTEETLKIAVNLKVIGKHGVGCDTIDLQAAKAHGIPVVNTPRANSNSVAELIVGLMLNTGRNISYCNEKTEREGFSRVAPPEVTGTELSGKTVGLVGTGNIARRAGEILHKGFSVTLLGYDPYASSEQMSAWGIKKYESLEKMFEDSDIINVSVPLTKSTENMIAAKQLEHCRKNAILINAARGGIVNENDLYEALKAGKLRAAACDAFVDEPPNGKNQLMSLPNFCGTPHIGANTEEALWRMGMEVVEEVLNVLQGGEPTNRVA